MPVVIQTLETTETTATRSEAPRAPADAGPPAPSLRSIELRLRQDQVRRARLRAH